MFRVQGLGYFWFRVVGGVVGGVGAGGVAVVQGFMRASDEVRRRGSL